MVICILYVFSFSCLLRKKKDKIILVDFSLVCHLLPLLEILSKNKKQQRLSSFFVFRTTGFL